MKKMKQWAALVAVLAMAGYAFAAEHPTASEQPSSGETDPKGSGMLDGKMFVGEIGKAGEETGDKDKLVFKQGTFVSTACVEHGFKAVAYESQEKDGVITFTAKPMNEAKETMSWSGTIKDGKVEAAAVHHTETEQTDYWFKGTLKTKKSEHPSSEHPSSEHPK